MSAVIIEVTNIKINGKYTAQYTAWPEKVNHYQIIKKSYYSSTV